MKGNGSRKRQNEDEQVQRKPGQTGEVQTRTGRETANQDKQEKCKPGQVGEAQT